MNIGFIGLGVMGLPMARHIQSAGHTIFTLMHHKAIARDLLDNGCQVLPTAEQVAQESEVIILMLPDTPQVEEVLFSEKGVVFGLGAGKMVIDMSSISPVATKQFAERIGDLNCFYLDAPVSGGEVGATAGTLSIMVGGDSAAFNKAKPLFELMGKNITHVGENGDGQTCKIANQIMVALNIEAVAEALLFASKAGADPVKIRTALEGGFASSAVLDIHGQRMIERNFDPGFQIALHQKDLRNALSSAQSLGLTLPNTAAVQEMFNSCVAHGAGELDHSALITTLELAANYKLHQK